MFSKKKSFAYHCFQQALEGRIYLLITLPVLCLVFNISQPLVSLAVQMMVSACNAGGDPGLIPGSGRSPGEGNGNPLQYSCLGSSMDRGA